MELRKVRIKNYRSVEDSEEFEIGRVTCLVGKNEAGKTAILRALAALKPHNTRDIKYDKEIDYPRRFLNDYDERHSGENAIVAETIWEMDDKDKGALEDVFGGDFVRSEQVVISRSYDEEPSCRTLEINEQAVVKHLISEFRLNATEKAGIKDCETTAKVYKILSAKQNSITDKQKQLIEKIGEYREQSATLKATDILSKRTPRFLYFSHYDRMNGEVSIDKLREDKEAARISESDQVFLDFIEYAGTTLDNIASADTYEGLSSQCESASNKITKQLMEYWTQNPDLEVVINLTDAKPKDDPPFNQGTIARARIKNNLHRVTVSFSERSAGFIWFFSFLVKFAQVKKEFGNVIILLDEPGLTLHGKAQADLLRYIQEKLKPEHQVIFSTHSPFMVPVERMKDVRIVEDVVDRRTPKKTIIHGTKVHANFMAKDPDTLFPLQGALGYDLAQNLFVSPHNLVVEGISDFIYLDILSSHLKDIGKTGLDDKWSIMPVGGADKVPTFVALLGGNHLDVTVLVDSQKAGHQKLNEIADYKLLQKNRIIMVGDIVQKKLAAIEDLFAVSDYLRLYNEAFEDEEVKESDLRSNDSIVASITRCIGKKFYKHGKPADMLMRNKLAHLENISDETIGNFEKLFIKINETLSIKP